jgi:acyl transferase domain-containing protein/NADPH:quinone reductase-like Zn-dependent oxidoreductase/acyl carrier protein
MACRLPRADSPAAFWDNLLAGRDAVTLVPPNRWDAAGLYDPDPAAAGKSISRHGAFLEDPWRFDADLFGISHREALAMDPQQRLLLELAWLALEDAGMRPDGAKGQRIGVYAGVGLSDYGRRHFWSPDAKQIDAWAGTGTFSSVAAGRISYALGLTGPALAVDTACSSSLVATHLAAQALRLRECDAAIVGGANLLLSPEPTIYFSRLRAMSPTGRCRTFSSSADGYVRGEGGALFVLKRLRDAERDGDRIHAILRGSAINQDGRSNGLTAPSAKAQTAVIVAALKNARISAADVGYVEAHGTGTPLGDPIEIDGLKGAYGDQPLRLGSVKSVVGHLEPAAGAVGMLKTLLVLKHGLVPPTLHLEQLNPRIRLGAFTIPTQVTKLDGPQLGGVSGFGLSGTNAHLLLAAHPTPRPTPDTGPVVITTSATTADGLAQLVSATSTQLTNATDQAFTAWRGRPRLRHRWAAVVHNGQVVAEASGRKRAGGLAFLFTGQGSQHPDMAKQLYAQEPVFRDAIDALLTDELRAAWGTDAVHDTTFTQPLVVAIELALAQLWEHWGVTPDLVVGQSLGEIAAATVAGAMTPTDAMRLATSRGAAMGALPRDGSAAVISTDKETVSAQLQGRAEVSGVNALGETTIAGPTTDVEATLARLSNFEVTRLRVSHAFHSACMDPALPPLREVAASIDYQPFHTPMVSAMEPGVLRRVDADYWVAHARKPVWFADAIAVTVEQGATTFLELGPHPVLSRLAEPSAPNATFAHGLRRGHDDILALRRAVATLHAAGHDLGESAVGPRGSIVDIPNTPLQRTHFELPVVSAEATGPVHPVLGARRDAPMPLFERRVSPGGWFDDHVIDGLRLFPAAEWIRMAAAAFEGSCTNLALEHALPVDGNLRLSTVVQDQRLNIYASKADDWQHCVSAERGTNPASSPPTVQGEPATLDLTSRGHAYGPSFLTATDLRLDGNYATATLTGDVPAGMVDGAMQLLALFHHGNDKLIPVHVGAVQWLRDPKGTAKATVHVDATTDTLTAQVWIADDQGVAVELTNLVVRAISRATLPGGPLLARLTRRIWGPATATEVDADIVDGSAGTGPTRAAIHAALDSGRALTIRTQDGTKAEQAAVWGLVRCLREEHPELSLRLLEGDGPAVTQDDAAWVHGRLYTPFMVQRPVPAALRPPADGVLGHLSLTGVPVPSPAPGQVALRVLAAGVNFRDVLMALGEYPGQVDILGGELVGEVVESAEETGLQLGDIVMGLATGALSDVAIADAKEVRKLPPGLSVDDAAGVPVAFLTAWMALQAAELTEGDRILIHSAAGGVGMAAVQIAKHLGATVVGTASEPKRALVRNLGVEDVRDSRSTQFAEGLPPVDVVLNSLAGELVDASFSVLCDGGRFIELGKRGVWSAEQAAEKRPDVGFVAFDLTQQPASERGAALDEILGMMASGALLPLPTQSHDAVDAVRVFTQMAAGRHTGKNVLRFSHSPGTTDGTVVVTGATGGVGRHLCESLLADGAQVLGLARSAPTDPVPGVVYRQVDVADASALTAALANETVVGAVHAAGASADATLLSMTDEHLSTAWQAKVVGAQNLAAALEPDAWLVLVGSTASMGNAGQGAYGAANAALDAVRAERSQSDSHCSVIHFGPWADTGLAKSMDGLNPTHAAALLAHMRRVDGVWFLPHHRPAAAESNEQSSLEDHARAVLGLPADHDIPSDRPLSELGLDSLMAVELRNRLSQALDRKLPATLLFDHPTLQRLTAFLGTTAPAKPVAPPEQGNAVAVVGMACRFPGGVTSPSQLWDLLRNGVDAVSKVPSNRFDVDRWYGSGPGLTRTREGAFLDDVAGFDAEFFGISPREAVQMDPQQRLLLEVAVEALERAGEQAPELQRAGVFLGICSNDYGRRHFYGADPERIDAWAGIGSAWSVAAGRISYALGLRGPALAVDTACSSSLVATHLAVQSLRRGETNVALVGGVNLLLSPEPFVYFSQLDALAPDGRCKTFSAAADGYGRGEGCAVLVLKRLEDAQRDGDNILAVVRGTAVNQDGRSAGITAPNGPAQTEVIRTALADAGVAPADVGYVEAHGTGTPLGDPIELQAAHAALSTGRSSPLRMGSIKTNVGHTEGAAGVAGLCKAILSLQHGEIPASLHFDEPNPHVDWSTVQVEIPTQTTDWTGRRVAGVSGFGLSGTNAHIVLEAWTDERSPPTPGPLAITLSAHHPDAAKQLAEEVAALIAGDPEHALQRCQFANARRRRYGWRVGATGATPQALADALRVAQPVKAATSASLHEVPTEASLEDLENLVRADLRGDVVNWPHAPVATLPTTPFLHQQFWLEAPSTAQADTGWRLALGNVPAESPTWQAQGHALPGVCRALLDHLAKTTGPVEIQTRGALDGSNPAQAGLWALARVLSAETGRTVRCNESGKSSDGARLEPVTLPSDTWRCPPRVLITGGSGGMGPELARWLSERGAEHVTLASRSSETDPLDVTVAAEVDQLIQRTQPDLVFHCAAVLHDGLAERLTDATLQSVAGPKVTGATLLDNSLRAHCPEAHLLVMSSLAATLGPPGQAAYAAANRAMEAVAAHRRANGFKATAIAFGPWQVGMGAGVNWAGSGLHPMAPARALHLLGAALSVGDSPIILADADWDQVAQRLPHTASVLGRVAKPETATSVDELVAREAGQVLRWSGPIPTDRGLFELGMDSVMAVELARRLESATGRQLGNTLVFDHKTVDGIAQHIASEGQPKAPTLAPKAVSDEAIAIVGVGCRFPGNANTPDAFWQLLLNGTDAVTEVPHDRWDVDALHAGPPGTPGRSYTRAGAFLDDVSSFDAAFHHIAPREALHLDPQQRLLLDVAWDALEDATLSPQSLKGDAVGVYVGIGRSDWFDRQRPTDQTEPEPYGGTGTDSSFAAGRIAYQLGLQGPALSVNTACSSSLVATHLAVRALRNGECRVALAGGVHLMLSPEAYVYLSQLRALSPTGRCHTFSAQADGYVRGEGAGMVALMTLSEASAQKRPVLAVIRGSAIGHDGASAGLTVPNGTAQEQVILAALADAGASPSEVTYVEAHGTGTPLGDPIEVKAATSALRPQGGKLTMGSVKTNVGHLEAAAGMAGLIKAALVAHHGTIPPHLHLNERNSDLPPVDIPTQQTPLQPGLVGVSSFGLSGTNAHIVLASPPTVTGLQLSKEPRLLPLSATSKATLEATSESWARSNESPQKAVRTAIEGRAAFPWRTAAVVGGDLSALATTQSRRASNNPRIGFLFTGQGSQWPQMASELLSLPAFAETAHRVDAALGRNTSLLDAWAGDDVHDTAWTQPALFALQLGLASWLSDHGVNPSAVIGHSIGEISAATVAGVFSLEDAARLVEARGRLMSSLPRDGAMAAIFAPVNRVLPHLTDGVSLAATNGPEETVISGVTAEVDEVIRKVGAEHRRLTVSHAFHSPLMEPMLDDFARVAASISYREPSIPLVSGKGVVAGPEIVGAGYWVNHVRDAVRFHEGVRAFAEHADHLVELGPHPVLLGMAGRSLDPSADRVSIPTLRRDTDSLHATLHALGQLWTVGAPVRFDTDDVPTARMPLTPRQPTRLWLDTVEPIKDLFHETWQPLQPGPISTWTECAPTLADIKATADGAVPAYLRSNDPIIIGLARTAAIEHPQAAFRRLIDVPETKIGEALKSNASEVRWNGEQLLGRQLQSLNIPHGVSPVRDATYLVTGGLGGIGRMLGDWLVRRGARRVVLSSRRSEVEVHHPNIDVVTADVSNRDDVVRLLNACGPDLAGVVHAAGILEDGPVLELGPQRLERVLAGKARGADLLHELTQGLDWFVMISSAAGVLGSAGQAAYAAANVHLDHLARRRHKDGLPAISLALGPVSEVGMAARQGVAGRTRREAQGLRYLAPGRVVTTLEALLASGHPTALLLDVADWSLVANNLGPAIDLVRPLLPTPQPSKALTAATMAPTLEEPLDVILRLCRELMGHSPDHVIDPDQPLIEQGLDSLMAVELRNRVQAVADIALPMQLVMSGAPARELANAFDQDSPIEAATPTPASDETDEPPESTAFSQLVFAGLSGMAMGAAAVWWYLG